MTLEFDRRWLAVVCLLLSVPETQAAEEPPRCLIPASRFFEDELWGKVGATKCLNCHRAGGDAEDSRFLLEDPRKVASDQRSSVLQQNRARFADMARLQTEGQPLILQKVVGDLDHGGGEVLPADSTGYRLLSEFVRRVNDPQAQPTGTPATDQPAPPFFAGVSMLDDRRLFRRATLSLAGRLPTDEELRVVASTGLAGIPQLLDAVLKEEAFFERLREGFNDIFLTLGVDGNPDQSVLSYEHFEKSRHWYQKHDLSHIADENERRQAGYKLARDYRKALLAEPMRLVDYIVRHERPFTEIVTADYILVSPYSARGYGIFEEVKDRFQDPEDLEEFIPVRLKALVGRSRSQDQDSATGFYPHAGLLSTFQYLARYPTTETNRNRLRVRMYYLHFLGVDVLELAARVSDAAAATAKFENPTMQAAECVVCHKTIDPVAGLFQDYWRFADQGIYGKRKEGWFSDMFAPGFEGESLPTEERWRALQWLGERTANDPRFAVAMVEHVYYILTGRKVLLPPRDIDHPLYAAQLRAYTEQRRTVEDIAERFAASQFNLKQVFKDWVVSDFYRADGLETAELEPCRLAELDDAGLMRLLSPEQLERKVAAVFGQPWGRLNGELAMLYGGIDSQEVTERATDPSGAMGAIQRILSNDIPCKQVVRDFARAPDERLLFPSIEPGDVPGSADETDEKIRRAIVHLHQRILGRYDAEHSAEVDRTFELFSGIVAEAANRRFEKRDIYSCRVAAETPVDDPEYTIRGWRAVVTYLLRRAEFLYE